MKYLSVLILLLITPIKSHAQRQSSLSVGGGVTYPVFAGNYDLSWFTSLHWNLRLGGASFIDTHIDLAEIGVVDYPDAPGVENDHNVYQFGIGYRHYFRERFFARGGLVAAIINDGEASARIFPTVSIGYDLFLTERHGLEFSLKNDLIKHFDEHSHISIFSLGVAYTFRYPYRK